MVERFIFTPPIPLPPEICVNYEQWQDCLSKSCWMLIWRHELWTQLEEGGASGLWEGQGPSFRRGSLLTPSHHACAAFWRHDLLFTVSAALYFNPATLTGSTRLAGQQPQKCNVSVVSGFFFFSFGAEATFFLCHSSWCLLLNTKI